MDDPTTTPESSTPTESGPSRSTDLSKTLPEEAFNQFLQGKRNMLVQDYSSAVHSLTAACEMYTSHFGELALECGEVHFLYGKALFRLSQQQAGVLGGALNEEVEEDEDDEDDEEQEEQGEESKENGEEKNESDGEVESAEKEEEASDKEPSESTDSPQEVPAGEEAVKPEGETANVEETPAVADSSTVDVTLEPETEDDLELAWNSLETAKSIFLRQGEENVEAQLKVSEIIQLLAEISMESDNNAAAIEDLKASLAIKERHLKPDDRLLAETYYQMGLALMLDKQYPEALDHFSRTFNILELRIKNLESTPLPAEEEQEAGSWAAVDRQKEIDDLKSVIADIKEKMDDTQELIRTAKKDLEDAILAQQKEKEKDVQIGFAKPDTSASNSKPVSNITHLLKRKKPDEENQDNDSKRIKITSSVQNGDSKATE